MPELNSPDAQDPDLWFRNGNCLVHLYGRGQSKRGPALKVPFSTLLSSKCQPLIERFMSHPDAGEVDLWSRAYLVGKVELYIPPPPGSNKLQALDYHLATRNFFAWVFRRSMVGSQLGGALVGVWHSMREFRLADADHVQDLLDYMDEEGYLDMSSQPNHALAVLQLAEVLQRRDLYIDAFAHCAGMSDRLFLSPEYEGISSISRKLIRRARADMDRRLAQAGAMLRTFLQEDLSEANLGLSAGARAHLDRFRTFLLAFYTAKLGYYPPQSVDRHTTVFDAKTYLTMAADFTALYEYLVDRSFTSAESSPVLAQGGICTLQSVRSFDVRHGYRSLAHPLPLLPGIASEPASSRRMSWLGRGADKLRPDGRLMAQAALLKATNQTSMELFSNDLVCAYRKFEEDTIFSPLRADRVEKLSHVDGRKVRWILIYSVHQTLRTCTAAPPEVRDCVNMPYHLAVSTADLPPWLDERDDVAPVRRATRPADRLSRSMSTRTYASEAVSPAPVYLEIKPDIDYIALAQGRKTPPTTFAPRSFSSGPPVIPPRSRRPERGQAGVEERELPPLARRLPGTCVDGGRGSGRRPDTAPGPSGVGALPRDRGARLRQRHQQRERVHRRHGRRQAAAAGGDNEPVAVDGVDLERQLHVRRQRGPDRTDRSRGAGRVQGPPEQPAARAQGPDVSQRPAAAALRHARHAARKAVLGRAHEPEPLGGQQPGRSGHGGAERRPPEPQLLRRRLAAARCRPQRPDHEPDPGHPRGRLGLPAAGRDHHHLRYVDAFRGRRR